MKAFTLVEVLVCLIIFGIIAIAASSIFTLVDKSWNWDMGLLDVQQEVRLVIDGMTREIREGTNLTNNGTSITFNVPDGTNPISYYLSGNQLIRENPAGTIRPISNDVSNVCFCWNGTTSSCDTGASCTKVFTIRVAGSKTVRQRVLPFTLIEKVRLRN